MTRRAQLIHLLVFLTGLVVLNYIVTGSLVPPTGDAAIWFHSGLLMLILGIYWIEPYFTKPADVVINGLVVFVSTSMFVEPPNAEWWTLLRYFALGCIIAGFIVVWAGSPAIAGYDTSVTKRLLYLIVIRLGNAAVLYSAVFVLALFSFFGSSSPVPRWMLGFWGLLLIAKHLDVEGLVQSILATFRIRRTEAIGRLTRYAQPNIARFEILPGKQCARGTLVSFTSNGSSNSDSLLGVVVAHRATPKRIEAEALMLDGVFAEGALDRRQVVVKVDANYPEIRARLDGCSLGKEVDGIIGFASKDSNISRIRFELEQGVRVEEGQLVAAWSLTDTQILFQITNGILFEEKALESGERSFTVGDAQQLGTWDIDRQGFTSHSWVVPENAPVVIQTQSAIVQKVVKPGLLDIGYVPHSTYPVNIKFEDLVLYHSAVLGVTGSGKSFLAYLLIEKCAESGIKVLCLDLSGDYQRYIRKAVRITSSTAIEPFLNDSNAKIGIVEFSEAGVHPITATKAIADRALEWCRRNRTDSEIRDPKPKLLLVLEEAHSLIPEWNSNPVPSLRDTVNATAQCALQARKYGLGFMVITQRTANVTKSILNQCNTIFAFQAYDETGFEFMKNYMGQHYVDALPILKKRQGVLVGKASASDRPVIVRFHDQDRQPASNPLPIYTAPQLQQPPPDPDADLGKVEG